MNSQEAPKPLSQKSDLELKREAEARLHHMSPGAANEFIESIAESPVAEPVVDFVNFLREKAIVGLAVGFVIGTQVQFVANSFINNIINPFIELLFPNSKNVDTRLTHVAIGSHSTDFKLWSVVYALFDFLFVLLVMYVIIRVLKLDKLDKKK